MADQLSDRGSAGPLGSLHSDAMEIRRLRAENERVRQVDRVLIDGFRASLAEVRAENDRLREALNRFGAHKAGCRRERWLPCTCGLETALASDEEGHGGS